MKQHWLVETKDGRKYVCESEFLHESVLIVELEHGKVIKAALAPNNPFRRSDVCQKLITIPSRGEARRN